MTAPTRAVRGAIGRSVATTRIPALKTAQEASERSRGAVPDRGRIDEPVAGAAAWVLASLRAVALGQLFESGRQIGGAGEMDRTARSRPWPSDIG